MKKVLIGITWLFSLGLIIYSLINTEQWFINGTLILGWLLFAIQMTMANFEDVYLFVKRIWFNITNPDCIWNMQVIFNGEFNREVFNNIDEIFTIINSDLRINIISNVRRTYKLKTILIETYIDEKNNKINFSIQDLEVSYRRSRKMIENELAIIFEKLQYSLRPENGDFGLNISFKEYNPYFGFYVRRLNANEIQGFNVTFNIQNDRVAVNKTSIEINTNSLQHLNNLCKQYLSLSPTK